MFEQALKDKYQFLAEYFQEGIKNSLHNRLNDFGEEKNIYPLAHSILFYGQDISAQYALATEISRLLNCSELQSENCRCINCNWARNKQHPAILTISKIDNKPMDDESKTVISIKQSQMVKNSLLNTSDFHRVFIFCDAKMEGETWIPMGLNKINFQEETANSLLKIIEEPPQNTTFFFLTRDKNDLIETIISRSQSFFVPSYNIPNNDYLEIEELFANYPTLERKNSLDLAQNLLILAKEQGSSKILDKIQNFLLTLMKSNLENSALKNKILNDIKVVELAKLQIDSHMVPQLALEDMCLNLTK